MTVPDRPSPAGGDCSPNRPLIQSGYPEAVTGESKPKLLDQGAAMQRELPLAPDGRLSHPGHERTSGR
jgi:hypothetical protein